MIYTRATGFNVSAENNVSLQILLLTLIYCDQTFSELFTLITGSSNLICNVLTIIQTFELEFCG